MKKLCSLVICVMTLLFVGCEPNAPATSSKVETGAASDITTKSVVLHGVVNVDISQYEDVEFGMMVSEDKAELNARDGEMYKAKVLIGKDFELTLKGLSPETKYYYCAWVFLNNTQYEFGSIKDFETEAYNPSNTAKAFSISDSKQVTFSQGNLQYHPANNKWRFAPSQLDYIGEANGNISSTYNGWLDLFAWSTVDWGTNKIGADAPNTWRTLTMEEWYYLRYTRTNANDLVGIAQVNGVNGLILLPDKWTCPSSVTFKSGFHSEYSVEAYGQYQAFTADEWLRLESAGAVFLPASGGAGGYSYDVSGVQHWGRYWSATEDSSDVMYCLEFYSDEAYIDSRSRYFGQAVRLVKDL